MATKLTKRIDRETSLFFKTRTVIVSLIPGEESPDGREWLEFRLKGTQQRIRRPLVEVFNASKFMGL